jgi:hypothetical protein
MSMTPGRGAVVTGAGSGFGRAVAHELSRRGMELLVSDIDAASAEVTAEAIRQAGGRAEAMRADVRDQAQVLALRERADAIFGGAEVLVNNAGVAVAGAVGEVPLEDWAWQIEINLWGVIYGCHHFLPGMKERRRGFILNVASAAGIVSAPLMAPYNVTKAGVIALSETLAVECAGAGVKVTALCPSFFRTDLHKRVRVSGASRDLSGATERLVTNSRWSAEAVAKVALDGLARGQLYVLPQADARALWRAKRALGGAFFRGVGFLVRRRLRGFIQPE